MKILVTGGAGFIGSNLVERLIRDGYEIVALDNLSVGSKENLSSVIEKITFVEGDVRDAELVNKSVKGCDFIFHEAAASSAPMFYGDPRDAYSSTVNGFLNVLHAAKENDVKRVIYASSSSIYATQPLPHREYMVLFPIDFYTKAKLAVEEAAKLYTEHFGLGTVGFRYFSVYGPHEKAKGKYANLVSQFLWAIKAGQSPVIYGDGTQTRDFTFVKDVLEANILAMDLKKKIAGEVFNVGTGTAKSFNDIVKILNKTLNTSIEPEYIENPIKNYVAHTLADTKKAEEQLGFKAKYSLEEGIREIKDLD